MLQTSLLLMKSFNKTETPIFCNVFFVSKCNLSDFYSHAPIICMNTHTIKHDLQNMIQ